jgi:hypothetical protein
MPEISRFLGIIIAMFYREHNPPHFHVRYNEYKAVIAMNDLSISEGKLPPKGLGLVIEWASIHQECFKSKLAACSKIFRIKQNSTTRVRLCYSILSK